MKNLPNLKVVVSGGLVLVLVTVFGQLHAQTLVDYNPADDSGLNGNHANDNSPPNPLTPSNVSPLISASNFVRGPGTANYDNAGGGTDFFGAFYTSGSDAALSDAVTNGIYETFSITASGGPIQITGFTLKNDFYYQNANTYTLEDSNKGFGTTASEQLATYTYTGSRYAPGTVVTFATPETLSRGATESFRLYVNGLGGYTDFGFGDGGSTPSNKLPFEVNGGVIPEPSTYAMLGLGLAALVMAVRCRSIKA